MRLEREERPARRRSLMSEGGSREETSETQSPRRRPVL